MSTPKIAELRSEVKRTMGNDYLGLTEGQPKPKKKRECCFVIYTPGGEHIMVQCDRLEQTNTSINLYNHETDENGKEYNEWIAAFYRNNIVGWEEIG